MATEDLLKYQCPCCGGALRFNAASQKIECSSCGNSYSEEVLLEYGLSLDKSSQKSNINWNSEEYKRNTKEMESQKGYICESCGAEILSDGNTVATECMYCGNPVVMPKQISGILTPDFVLPFKITKEEAKQKLLDFYKGKKLLPNDFKSNNRLSKITGMYVPFWLFDCGGSGFAQYRGTKVISWSDSDYIYTKTDYYDISREGQIEFEKIPVDASLKMEDDYMDGLEPYDYEEMKPFDSSYLAGFFADKYDVDVDTSAERASERVKNSTQEAFTSTINGYTSVIPTNINIQMDGKDIRYALLPVWMLNTKYEGKMYQFAINGQTGKVSGDLPIDNKKYWIYFILTFIIATVILAGLSLFLL